jgi:hypothetical protein
MGYILLYFSKKLPKVNICHPAHYVEKDIEHMYRIIVFAYCHIGVAKGNPTILYIVDGF